MNNRPAVLIVDDDASLRAMLSLSLKRAGYPALSASNGEEALRMLSLQPIDCMVTDGKMEPMNGFELSSRAKSLRPGLRIAMVSAVYNDSDALGTPVERVFEKPVAVSSIVAWLQQH